MRKTIVVMSIVLAGCATPWHWERPGSTDREFNMDAGQCRAQSESLYGPPMQRLTVYFACMEGKGWQRMDDR